MKTGKLLQLVSTFIKWIFSNCQSKIDCSTKVIKL